MKRTGLPSTLAVLGVAAAIGITAPTAAAVPAGQLLASGYNGYGQLGSTEGSYFYVFMPVEGMTNVVQASPGYYSSLALLSNGTVDATGYNEYGELGNGTSGKGVERHEFAPVPGVSNAIAVSEGYLNSVALLSNGTVDTWGYNDYGESGDGEYNTTGCDCNPSVTQVKGVGGVGTLSSVVAVSAGGYDTLALLSNGTVVAWGYNGEGELGDGESENSDVPVQVKGVGGVGTLSNVVAISAGGYFNMALLANGTVVTWGYNHYGELGDGENSESKVPVQVAGVGGSGMLSGVSAVSAGAYFGLELLSNGSVAGQGYNYYGELGNGGHEEEETTPVGTAGLSGVTAITTGEYYSMALLENGGLEGWGYGEDGELGNGIYGPFYTIHGNKLAPGVISLGHGGGSFASSSLVVQGATASVSASSLSFPSETVGSPSAAQSVTLTNNGPAPLMVSGDVLTGMGTASFMKGADTCTGATLADGATCKVEYTFKPAAAGAESASLAFTSSAAKTVPAVALAGTGTPVPVAPKLGAVTLSKSTFRAAPFGPSVTAAAASGTVISYTDSEVAIATFTVQLAKSGVTIGHGKSAHCGKPPKHGGKGKKHCTYYKPIGAFTHTDVAGKNSFRFTGRVISGKLKPGPYRLVAVAASTGGKSTQRTAKFKIKS